MQDLTPSPTESAEPSAKVPFPFRRDDANVFELLRHAWQRFVENPGPFILATVAILGIGLALGIVREVVLAAIGETNSSGPLGPFGEITGVARAGISNEMLLTGGVMAGFQLVQAVISEAVQLGIVGMGLQLTRNEPAALSEVLQQGKKFWKSVIQQLLIAFITALMLAPTIASGAWGVLEGQPMWLAGSGVLFVLTLVPLVYVLLGFSFSRQEIVLDDRCGPIAGLMRSWQVVRGRRLDTLTVGLVNVVLAVVGLLLCCIGSVVTTPLSLIYSTMFFVALRHRHKPAA